MIRKNVLDLINEVLEDNLGNVSTEDTLVKDTGVDSFGIVMLLLALDEQYGCFPTGFEESVDYEVLTLGHLIDRVIECS